MSKERTRTDRPRQAEGVRAFKRGLDVLHEVNRSGGIRAGDVARALDLPRPTVYRLLETLEELGYVASQRQRRPVSSHPARAQPRRRLRSRRGDPPGRRRPIWPSSAKPWSGRSISTYENAAMVVQETTHSRSPLSIDRGMIGKRLPMLRTSAGRAYLAACPARERDLIINHLRRIDETDDRPFLDEGRLDRMIAETQARGYAIRNEGEYNPKTASIAVPIVRNGAVFGCISIIWIRSALGIEEAVTRFANQLQEAASAIPVEV